MTPSRTKRTIEGIWTVESAKFIASVASIVQDDSLAEDLAQDAMVIALEHGRSQVFRRTWESGSRLLPNVGPLIFCV